MDDAGAGADCRVQQSVQGQLGGVLVGRAFQLDVGHSSAHVATAKACRTLSTSAAAPEAPMSQAYECATTAAPARPLSLPAPAVFRLRRPPSCLQAIARA